MGDAGDGHDGEIALTRRDTGKAFHVTTGRARTFRVRRLQVHWLEMESAFFRLDSAVLMPDAEAQGAPGTVDTQRGGSLALLVSTYRYAQEHPEHRLLIAGHADPTEAASLQEGLSKRRAENVLLLLLGSKEAWVKNAHEYHQPEDIKHLLRWVHRSKGWPCATDSTGNTLDDKTKKALQLFQKEFSKPGNGYTISASGAVSEETWGAIFHLYSLCLAEMAHTTVGGLGALRGKLHWLHDDLKSLGAGATHPVRMTGKAGFLSQKDRRVELLFFAPGEEPLKKPAGGLCHADGQAGAGRCLLYNPKHYQYATLVPAQLTLTSVDDHFAPGHERLDLTYRIDGLEAERVTLEVTSPHYAKNPIFRRELTGPEKSNGVHTLHWDGHANCAEGDLKDALIHPLYGPYTVRLQAEGRQSNEATFKVLYHSLRLAQGPWTPDGAEPPKTREKDWVQYKLNELGYHGGPVGKDTDNYLARAVIRYKANHKKMHQLVYANYNSTITPELKSALTLGENKRPILDGDALTDETKESRILVEALTYETKAEFSGNKAAPEKARLNRPLIPIEAEILLRSKSDTGVSSPKAVGPVRVNWRFTDPDEDLLRQHNGTAAEPSKTRKYLEKSLKLQNGRTANHGDNSHVDFGGIRDTPDKNGFAPVLVGDFYVPHVVAMDMGQKVVFSKACTDSKKHPKRVGRAGFFFRPSYIAGDDYRIRAEIDFTGLPNQAQLESVHSVVDQPSRIHVDSGVLRVWRTAKVAMCITWPPRTNANQWAEIAAEFEKAFLHIDIGHITTKKISEVLTSAQYKQIVAHQTTHLPPDIQLQDDALVGVTLPTQGSLNAANYKLAVKTFTNDNYWKKIVYDLREQLSKNIRKDHPTGFIVAEFLTHKPVSVKRAPPADMTVVDPSHVTWSFSIGLPDSMIFADQKDPDRVYYVVAHEMGHNFWLQHWEHAGGSSPADHDTDDHNCLMSYSSKSCPHVHHRPGTYTPHFCGQCNLKLRGWDIDHASIPTDSL